MPPKASTATSGPGGGAVGPASVASKGHSGHGAAAVSSIASQVAGSGIAQTHVPTAAEHQRYLAGLQEML